MFEDLDTLQSHTQDWPLLESPLKMTIICAAYLVFIYYAGPKYMKNRKSYTLKTLLTVYNLFQVIVSFYLAKLILDTGVSFKHLFQCISPDYSDSPVNIYRARITYYGFLLKFLELVETICFVLRKKQNQVSKLHVYHHISTIYIGYFGVKFIGCNLGCISFPINLIVHFFMYSYYLLSLSDNTKLKKLLQPCKVLVTRIQIIQFFIMITSFIMIISQRCLDPISTIGAYFALPNVCLLLFMFVKFYKKSYNEKKTVDSKQMDNVTVNQSKYK